MPTFITQHDVLSEWIKRANARAATLRRLIAADPASPDAKRHRRLLFEAEVAAESLALGPASQPVVRRAEAPES